MPYSSIDRKTWDDAWFRSLNRDARLLFIYCWSNVRVNAACCYPISPHEIAYGAGFETDTDPAFVAALEAISDRVIYFPADGFLWVKNFIRRQSDNQKYLQGVVNCLREEVPEEVGRALLDYNRARGLVIPYAYPMDTVSGAGITTADTLSAHTHTHTHTQDIAPNGAPPPDRQTDSNMVPPAAHTSAIKTYHDLYLAKVGTAPKTIGRAVKLLQQRLQETADSPGLVEQVIAVAFNGSYWAFRDDFPTLAQILADTHWDALVAHAKGVKPAGAKTMTDEEAFYDGGA